MSVDASKIRPGVTVVLNDGTTQRVKGAYMGTDGLVLTAQYAPGSIVDRNIPLADVLEIKEGE